jgi:hypothetical protein
MWLGGQLFRTKSRSSRSGLFSEQVGLVLARCWDINYRMNIAMVVRDHCDF